jgi:2-keto-3-deoxy-L-rhamnonate aldolase RhmA
MSDSLKQRLARGDLLLGTWVKTPSMMIAEVLTHSPLDLVCLDAEHAPFDRGTLDQCLGALSLHRFPALVRVPSQAAEHTLNALDSGADGIVVPHVTDAASAAGAVQRAHFGPGGRGFAGSTRAAAYTHKPMARHLEDSAASTVVVAQIEDVEAVENIEAIAAVDSIDCLFVGRADLTVAFGAASPEAPEVVAAVERVCRAGRAAGRPTGMFLGDLAELPRWRALGATLFLLSSDHGCLLAGVRQLADRFHSLAGGLPDDQIR